VQHDGETADDGKGEHGDERKQREHPNENVECPNGDLLASWYGDRPQLAESKDDGLKWGPVGETSLPNPGSGIDGVRLANGHWLLIYNDSTTSRASLAVSVSEDEGRTWKVTRHLERHAAGNYHYPALIQGHDGTLHAIYSCFIASDAPVTKVGEKRRSVPIVGKGIKHAAFNEAWIRLGD
jgi:hypothetical protein